MNPKGHQLKDIKIEKNSLELIILSVVSQTETGKYDNGITYIWNLKTVQMNLETEINIDIKSMSYCYQKGKEG